MRIILVAMAVSPHRGSEAGSSWRLAVGLAEAGHDVELITSRLHHEEWVDEALPSTLVVHLADDQLRHVRLGRSARAWYARYNIFLRTSLQVAKQVHHRQPADVAHHYSWGSLIWGSPLWRVGIPTVFGPAGGGAFVAPEMRSLLDASYARKERAHELLMTSSFLNPVVQSTLRRSSVLAANSDTAALITRITGIRPRVMCDTWASRELLAELPQERSMREDRRIVWIGRLIPRKAAHLALMAMRHLPDYQLVIAGDGPLRGELEQSARDLGVQDRVDFRGSLPWADTMDLLRTAQAMMFTSARDAFGSQLLEAAASGTPIVALDQHGTRDFIPANAGRLVPPHGGGDFLASGLARGIRELTENSSSWVSSSQASRAFAESMSVERQVEKMLAIYEQVAGGDLTPSRHFPQ